MSEDELKVWLAEQVGDARSAGYELTEGEVATLVTYAEHGIDWTSLVMHDVAGRS